MFAGNKRNRFPFSVIEQLLKNRTTSTHENQTIFPDSFFRIRIFNLRIGLHARSSAVPLPVAHHDHPFEPQRQSSARATEKNDRREKREALCAGTKQALQREG